MKLKKLAKMKNKIIVIISSVIAIYAIIGFIAIPKIAKPQIVKTLEGNLTQKASLGKVEFNPFLLKFTIHDIKIYNKEEAIISLDKLFIDFSLYRSFMETHLAFKDLQLVNPYINITEYEDGTLNLQKLLKESPKEDEQKETKENKESVVKFQIYKTILDNAKIKFTKLSKDAEPFYINIDKLDYTFYDMGTYRNILASHSLKIIINKNTELNINGGLRLAPFEMYGNVKLTNLRPSEFLGYKKDMLNFTLDEKGTVDLNFGFKINDTKALNIIINDANLNLRDFDLLQGEKSLISLEDLNLEQLNIFYPQNKIDIKNLSLNNVKANVQNDKNGILNLSTLINKKNEEAASQEPINTNGLSNDMPKENIDNKEVKNEETNIKVSKNNQTKPWEMNLEKFTLKNSNVNFKDLANALFINTKEINIDLNNLKVEGSHLHIDNINLAKPTITFKDEKNNLTILNKELEAIANNITLKDSILNLESLQIKNKELDFKDLKNNMQLFTKATLIDVKKINKTNDEIIVDNVSLKNPSLLFNDNKSKMKVLTNLLNLNLDEISLKDKDLNLKKATLKVPTLKLDDKTDKTIIANKLSLKLNNISQNEKGLSISKINLTEQNLRLKDNISKMDVEAKNINVNINKTSFVNNALKVVSTNINKPFVSITLEKNPKSDKNKGKTQNTKPKKKTKKPKDSFAFDIGPVKIQNMKMSFEDKNLPIPFKSDITKMNGEFSRLNSSSSKPTKLKLEGTVDKYGYTKITGTVDINDIKLLTDTSLLFKNIAIKNFTPYSGKFIGREIESGKLNLDLKYNIKKSDLNAKNSINISDIKLGKNIESPDAVNLPLELAIALLEDSNNVVHIELPIKGNVDDPKFSIAPIVWKAFTNLIVKAISSPFTLLGSIFNISGDDIKNLEYEFGKSEMLVSEKESLDNIAKILSKKPKLAIKLKPAYNPSKDKTALQNIKLEKILATLIKKDSKADEYKNTLETLYKKDSKAKPLEELIKTYTKKDKEGKESLDKEKYVEYLRKQLSSKQTVTKKELENLANQRVQTILNYMTKVKKLSKDTIKVEDITIQDKNKAKWVVFDLDVTTR